MEKKIFEYAHALPKEQFLALIKELCFHFPSNARELSLEIANALIHDYSMKEEEFKDMIDKRKLEHVELARESRKNDLQRIAEMNSKHGLDPYEIFPKEIWKKLFDFFTPNEKLYYLYVHESFSEVLGSENIISKVLFPLVLGCKFFPFWKPEQEYRELDVAIPYFLAENSLLRLVSRSIRNAVDKWYEQNLLHNLQNMTESPRGVTTINLEKLEDCRRVVNMVDHLNADGTNFRYFTRSLKIVSPVRGDYNRTISLQERQLLEQVDAKLNELLEHIGDQIWFFQFDYRHPSYSERIPSTVKELSERYDSCVEWLSRMPNLRWLIMSIDPGQVQPHLVEESRWYWDPTQLPGRRVAPALHALERLDLELTEKNMKPLSIFNHFLQTYHHVKYLKLVGLNSLFESEGSVLYPYLDPPGSSSEPTTLSIHMSRTFPGQEDDSDFEDEEDSDQETGQLTLHEDNGYVILDTVTSKAWPLKRLDLNLAFYKVNLEVVLHIIECIQSLEDLRLSATNSIIRNDLHCIMLPKLTHFELALKITEVIEKSNCWGMLFSLHFLILNRNIRSLNIAFSMMEECWLKLLHETETVEYTGMKTDLDKVIFSRLGLIEGEQITEKTSNIWHVLRNLNHLKLRLMMTDEEKRAKKSVSKEVFRSDLTLA